MCAFLKHSVLLAFFAGCIGYCSMVYGNVQGSGITKTVDLSGQWRFQMDQDNNGHRGRWFNNSLEDTIKLPGTMAQNGKGRENENRNNVRNLGQPLIYSGKAWYQRDIDVPADWLGHHMSLRLERSKVTSVWINDVFVGTNDSLGCDQIFDLSHILEPGQNRLTICVDNEARPGGSGGHQITDDTQTNWNGIVGKIELNIAPAIWINNLWIYPDAENKKIRVRAIIGNLTGKPAKAQLQLKADSITADHSLKAIKYDLDLPASMYHTYEYIYEMGEGALLWNEFTPHLYALSANLQAQGFNHSTQNKFGLRDFKTRGTQFTINGSTIQLRGKHDGLVWPIEGYASMDLQEWIRVLKIAKSYGMNHYRFHSCTPPAAAFEAADIVGIYMQPELYNFGGDHSNNTEGAEYMRREGRLILETYANHPSFVMMALGNELGGGRATRQALVQELRNIDATRLYAQGSNNEFWNPRQAKGDDYWASARTFRGSDGAIRGAFSHADLPLGHIQALSASTLYDFGKAVAASTIPVIGHEMGQFQVTPNFDEIAKYTGVQKPWCLEIFAQRLKEAGMFEQWPDFFRASGALSVLCYREDVETVIRTRGMGGLRLLDLQDFPGQGIALVGILDSFMDSKGLITPEQWRQFCSEVVPLVRMGKYVWQGNETFEALIQVANYSLADINEDVNIKVVDSDNKVIFNKDIKGVTIKQGGITDIENLRFNFPDNKKADKLNLIVDIKNKPYRNEYPLWLYPDNNAVAKTSAVHIKNKLDNETMQLLSQGKKVLLFPAAEDMPNSVAGLFTSDYWCYPMFYSICVRRNMEPSPGTLGILCNPEHPVFNQFPTDYHSNWQWRELIMNSRAMVLDDTPKGYKPLVQVIDNFVRNHKLSLLFECKVGTGSLLVCSIDLEAMKDRAEARQLYNSILSYMTSDDFAPETTFAPELLVSLFREKNAEGELEDDLDYGQFFGHAGR